MKLFPISRYRRGIATVAVLTTIATCTAACNRDQTQITADASGTGLESGGVSSLNYSPWYIHTSEIVGPDGSGVQGGGPNWPCPYPTHPINRRGFRRHTAQRASFSRTSWG